MTDYISRADALAVLQHCKDPEKGIQDLPGVKPFEIEGVNGWIPVTERLPKGENGKDVCDLVVAYTKDGEVTTGWLNGQYWWVIIGQGSHHVMRDRSFVTHWMPLPERPKE